MRRLLAIAMMAILALGTGISASLADNNNKRKVVYHINYDDQKRHSGTLRNIQNHINTVGKENLDLRVVMHGEGVSLLKYAKNDPQIQRKVVSLKKQGIKFNVCANTLIAKRLNYKNDLYDVSEKDIVPNGIAEIADLQTQGYAYIKP